MKLKKWLACLSILVILSLLLGPALSCSKPAPTPTPTQPVPPASTPPANAVILKLAVAIPPQDPMVQALLPWIESFNKAANGAFEMQLFAGGSLGGTSDMLDATRTGAVETGHGPVPTFSGTDPAFSAAEVPFLFNNFDANAEFCRLIQPYQDGVFQKKFNQKFLSSWNMGFTE